MAQSKAKSSGSGILHKVIMATVAISFASLLLMMLWGTADVVFVKLGHPLPGTINYTEVLNVIVLFLPLAYVTHKKSHIVVDLITYKGRAKRVTEFVADFSVFIFSGFLAWQLGIRAWESLRSGEFDMIGVKVYLFPAKIALALGALGSTLVALIHVLGHSTEGKHG
jgi:TRAP-type C4-dicarboxylate transport system permease small subunit